MYFSVNILWNNIISHYTIVRSSRSNKVLILKGFIWIISFNFINLAVDFSKKLSTNNILRRNWTKIYLIVKSTSSTFSFLSSSSSKSSSDFCNFNSTSSCSSSSASLMFLPELDCRGGQRVKIIQRPTWTGSWVVVFRLIS
jgi:hypothetical protein